MYRLDRMRKQYEQFTAAERYFIGFEDEELVYNVEWDKIPRRFTRVQKECSKCGGGYGLYVNITGKKVQEKLKKHATVIGKASDLISDKYNKGVMFEKMVYEFYG